MNNQRLAIIENLTNDLPHHWLNDKTATLKHAVVNKTSADSECMSLFLILVMGSFDV